MLSGHWGSAKELHSWLKAEFLANGSPFDRAALYEMLANVGKAFIAGPLYRKGNLVEITVCGFLGQVATIAILGIGKGTTPHIDFRHSFATTGSGGPISETFLNIRDCKPQDSLARTMYIAYEAKKYSEKVSGVGVETRLIVLAPPPPDANPEQIQILSLNGGDFLILEAMRSKYGIQQIATEGETLLAETLLVPSAFRLNPATPPNPQHPTTDQ